MRTRWSKSPKQRVVVISRARSSDELNNIYMLLDQLEPIEKDKQFFRPRSDLFYWPLALALVLAGMIGIFKNQRS